MKAYRIKDWDEHYETSESKKIKNLRWVAVPVKHSGKSFRRIMAMKNGSDIFSCFILIIQVAALMPQRGLLVDRDGPLTPEDLYFKTGMPEAKFKMAMEALSSKKIGWMELVECETPVFPEENGNLPEQPDDIPEHPDELGDQPEKSCLQDRTGQDTTLPHNTQQNTTTHATRFDAWYSVYPRRQAKGAAKKAFVSAMKSLTPRYESEEAAFEWLLAITRQFAESPKGRGDYVPYPATWLNAANYDDDTERWKESQNGKHGKDHPGVRDAGDEAPF